MRPPAPDPTDEREQETEPQNQVNPDSGDAAKASSNATGRLQSLRLFSTLLAIALKTFWAGAWRENCLPQRVHSRCSQSTRL